MKRKQEQIKEIEALIDALKSPREIEVEGLGKANFYESVYEEVKWLEFKIHQCEYGLKDLSFSAFMDWRIHRLNRILDKKQGHESQRIKNR